MSDENFLVGIDVGNETLKAVVGEIDENNEITVICEAEKQSDGFKDGTVINIEKAISSVLELINDLEKQTGKHITDIIVGIAGGHIKGINSSGTISIPDNREIIKEDITMVLEHAKTLPIPPDSEILHVLPLSYTVDNKPGIKNPLGLSGKKLYVEVHVITCQASSAQNILNCFEKSGLNVRNVVLNPLAASHSVLSHDEKELGIVLLDIGYMTSDLIIFTNSGIKHTQVLGLGGYNITKDISKILKIPFKKAEEIKLKYGNAIYNNISDKEFVEVSGGNGEINKIIHNKDLCEIINARLEEIFYMLQKMIDETRLMSFIYGGIVLTGGSSGLPGIDNLCKDIMGVPVVRIGYPKNIKTEGSLRLNPKYSCASGLLLHALNNTHESFDDINTFDKIMRIFKDMVKNWF